MFKVTAFNPATLGSITRTYAAEYRAYDMAYALMGAGWVDVKVYHA